MQSRCKTIRLLLADDHQILREGIRSCLKSEKQIKLVAEAGDGEQAVKLAAEFKPDVVLLDINMPRLNGLMAISLLRKEIPETRILLLTGHSNREYVLEAVRRGANGYVLKEASPEDLIKAIRSVAEGNTYYSPEITQAILQEFANSTRPSESSSELSAREREVLALIASEKSNKEIASELNLSVRTVETHRERLMRKLNIHTVAGLTRYALARGVIHLE